MPKKRYRPGGRVMQTHARDERKGIKKIQKKSLLRPKNRSIIKKTDGSQLSLRKKRVTLFTHHDPESEPVHYPFTGLAPQRLDRPVQLGFSFGSNLTRKAYTLPQAYEEMMIDNGHLNAENHVMINEFFKFIGTTVVSLSCGTGWLDRELVKYLEKLGHFRRGGELRLLGIDDSFECIQYAKEKMDRLIQGNPRLQKYIDEKKLMVQYERYRLGSPDFDAEKGAIIPSFSDIDLEETVIGESSPDTYLIFMALSLWIEEREEAVRSIAERCRKETSNRSATCVINGEEYPIHTPNEQPIHGLNDNGFREDFVKAVKSRIQNQADPRDLWNILFPKYHLRQADEFDVQFWGENHTLHSAVLKYTGGSNPFLRKIQL